jgi:glycosyltransferase involved in cell wall biosynthesis
MNPAPLAPRYSLVVPFHNEAGNIAPLLAETLAVLRAQAANFEIVLVNDGSTDTTANELAAVIATDQRCRTLSFAENCGQATALYAGLQTARGAIILTMDGDGQNDPADFPALLALVDRGDADLVCGYRGQRRDPWLRRLMSRVSNSVRRRLLRDGVHDAGCQLRVFRREVIASLRPSRMLQSFLPAMAAAADFRVRELPVRHRPRRYGRAHYGLHNLWWRPVIDTAVLWWQLRGKR